MMPTTTNTHSHLVKTKTTQDLIDELSLALSRLTQNSTPEDSLWDEEEDLAPLLMGVSELARRL